MAAPCRYPTTSSIAAEKAESSPKLLKRRGRTVLLTFAMQGWGQVINVGSLLILLLMFNSTGNPPYSAAATGATYRVSYALMLPFLVRHTNHLPPAAGGTQSLPCAGTVTASCVHCTSWSTGGAVLLACVSHA